VIKKVIKNNLLSLEFAVLIFRHMPLYFETDAVILLNTSAVQNPRLVFRPF